MTDKEIITKLVIIKNNLIPIIEELKKKNGIINSDILDELDNLNKLTVEV